MVLDQENVKLQYHLLKRIPVAPRSYDIITTDEQQAWQSVKRDARRHVSHLAAAEADAPVQFPKAFKQLSVGTFPLLISQSLVYSLCTDDLYERCPGNTACTERRWGQLRSP